MSLPGFSVISVCWTGACGNLEAAGSSEAVDCPAGLRSEEKDWWVVLGASKEGIEGAGGSMTTDWTCWIALERVACREPDDAEIDTVGRTIRASRVT